MTELIYVYGNSGASHSYSKKDLKTISKRVIPDNAPQNIKIIETDNTIISLINPVESISVLDNSVCLGQMAPPRQDWNEPGNPIPSGSFCLIRSNNNMIELVSDKVGSRTLFYYEDNDLFIASTSQRAIIQLVGSFQLEESAIAWLLSSGCLGPSQTWDKRIDYLPANTTLTYEKDKHRTRSNKGSVWNVFEIEGKSKRFHRDHLENSIANTHNNLNIDYSKWKLSLSGGIDSRGILRALQDKKDLQTITLGVANSENTENSDVTVAQKLSKSYGLDHDIYTLPETPSDIGTIFNRFVTASEGRIDHLSGYLDGFETYEALSKSNNMSGLIRGNSPFVGYQVKSKHGARRTAGGSLISDHDNLPDSTPGAINQHWPGCMDIRNDESLKMYLDWLYLVYRLPVVQASLTSIKTPYIEEINPLVADEIINSTRSLPDDLRKNKQLYKDIVLSDGPDIPLATVDSVPSTADVIKSEIFKDFLLKQLHSNEVINTFGEDLTISLADQIENDRDDKRSVSTDNINSIKRNVGELLPSQMIRWIEKYTPVDRPPVEKSPSRLALRICICHEMLQKLRSDPEVL